VNLLTHEGGRPGTATGPVFITLEDGTGLSKAIVSANTVEEYRLTIQHADGTTHVMAEHIEALEGGELPSGASHDFH